MFSICSFLSFQWCLDYAEMVYLSNLSSEAAVVERNSRRKEIERLDDDLKERAPSCLVQGTRSLLYGVVFDLKALVSLEFT